MAILNDTYSMAIKQKRVLALTTSTRFLLSIFCLIIAEFNMSCLNIEHHAFPRHETAKAELLHNHFLAFQNIDT